MDFLLLFEIPKGYLKFPRKIDNKSDSKEDIDKAVEDLSKIAQPLSDKLFKKEQAAQEDPDNEDSKDKTDDAVDAEFKEVDDEKDK